MGVHGSNFRWGRFSSARAKKVRLAQRPLHTVNISRIQFKFGAQELDHALVHRGLNFETDHGSKPSLAQFIVNHFEEIIRLLLVPGDIGIACDAEGEGRHDFHAWVEAVKVGNDDLAPAAQSALVYQAVSNADDWRAP